MRNYITTFTCYSLAIPAAIGTRMLPVLGTMAQFLWLLLTEQKDAPTLTAVMPLPVAAIPSVTPDEDTLNKTTVKDTKTSSTTAKRTRREATAASRSGVASSSKSGSPASVVVSV